MRTAWACCVALVLAGCQMDLGGGGDEKGGKDKRRPTPATVVETVTVGTGSVSDLLVASGVVEAEASADLMPEASGMVLRVEADVGDAVRKGQLLAVIRNESVDAGAQRAADEVRHLEARVTEMRALADRGAVSSRELADLEYQLQTARTSLREAQATQSDTRLVAPFAGVVAARDVKVGELASSATRAFQVVDLTELHVEAQLPERDVSRVAIGQPATLTSAYDASRTAAAEVSRISPVIDPNTGTFQVKLTLDPDQDVLRPGQYVNVALEVNRHEDVVVLPRDAVLYENGAPVAFRMEEAPPEPEPEEEEEEEDAEPDEEADADDPPPEEEGPRWIARKVALELGLVDATHAEVTEGVAIGEAILVAGHRNLRDGARIRLPRTDDDQQAAEADAPAEGDEG